MRKSSLVFELTDGEIRAFWFSVHPFRKLGHRYRSDTVKFDRIPIPTGIIEQGNVRDENALIGILVNYRAQTPRKSQKVYLAIPLQQGFIRSYALPWIPKRDRKSAMSLLVDEEIPIAFARSDLLYDFLVISEEKQISLQVLLGAARQSLLEGYVCVFGQAGFKVTGVDFSFSVLGQALGFEPNEDILYLQGEPDSFHMVLFRGAVPETVRTLPALRTATESVEGTKERTEVWGNEIRRFLLYYRTQKTDLNLKRLVWSGDSVKQLAHELHESNHVSVVEQVELQGLPGVWREILEIDNARGEAAVSYALRISAQRPALNLWRESNEMETVHRRYQGIAFFTCALLMIGTMTWVSLYQKTISLQQEVQQLSDQGARILAQAKHQEELEVAWKKVKIDQEKIGVGLIQVQAMPSTELTIEHISYKQGSLSLSGRANDAKSVQTLIHNVRTMGWEQPGLSSYKLTSRNNVEFSLSAKRGIVGTQNTMEDSSASLDEGG
ncbi:MAG TPA: pilus assembly protein PilM [Desulfosporosinus sp.]|nr:pilus assembly protein PilM [Desulfosporosinus sp.]